jgi:hypothetical protein
MCRVPVVSRSIIRRIPYEISGFWDFLSEQPAETVEIKGSRRWSQSCLIEVDSCFEAALFKLRFTSVKWRGREKSKSCFEQSLNDAGVFGGKRRHFFVFAPFGII